jgi:hypothetical protein
MTQKGYTIKSIVVCDDIRQEISGKEILIGVYNDVMVFTQFPAIWPLLIVRFSVLLERQDFKTLRAYVKDQRDRQVFTTSQALNFSAVNIEEPVLVGFAIRALKFDEPSRYRIFLGLDSEPEEVSFFVVRTPTDMELSYRK